MKGGCLKVTSSHRATEFFQALALFLFGNSKSPACNVHKTWFAHLCSQWVSSTSHKPFSSRSVCVCTFSCALLLVILETVEANKTICLKFSVQCKWWISQHFSIIGHFDNFKRTPHRRPLMLVTLLNSHNLIWWG